MTDIRRIAVIGGGAWGTALAQVARTAGRDVVLWARDAAVVEAVNARHENPSRLPGVPLDPAIGATTDMAAALAGADAVLLVCPAQALRGVAGQMAPHLAPGLPVVLCAKGIEIESGLTLVEVLAEALPGARPAVLSGPTFAAEVARGQPTAVTLACADAGLGPALVAALGSRRFRPYHTADVVGVEIGGAVKNVLAIGSGIVQGRGLGENARAALLTRGLAEIMRLGAALGGRPETLMGLSGLGDLALTCASLQSRNTGFGHKLGQGQPLAAVLAAQRAVAEGVATARAVAALAGRLGVDMPICAAVDAILHHGAEIDATIDALLSRPFRAEGESFNA
ncbi:MAG TPA: NAD(P)H-dependent glycerol-3-phosphate dehydrogenase [Alphaproteobacteria bacterium]|nr:NAD(P)H-dependent glycerol-3-phosphate dehydrogenase [Alphaproteobacteria bacterium]